jgi:hypothetical protein
MILVLICLVAYGSGQNKWLKEAGFENVQPLNGIYFTDNTHGWAVGDSGEIVFFNGQKWQQMDNPARGSGYDLMKVFFLNPDLGWAVGTGGIVMKYDGGKWTLVKIASFNSTVTLYDIIFVNNYCGWIVGSEGTFLQYDGKVWNQDTVPVLVTFNSLYFLDHAHGWAAGDEGTILYYNGYTWTIQNHDTAASTIHDIYMLDTNNGWSAEGGPDRYFFMSGYNGTSWSPLTFPVLPLFGSGHLSALSLQNPSMGRIAVNWAKCGYYGFRIHRIQGSAFFEESSEGSCKLNDLVMLDSLSGWACGGGTYRGFILRYNPQNTTKIKNTGIYDKTAVTRKQLISNKLILTMAHGQRGCLSFRLFAINGADVTSQGKVMPADKNVIVYDMRSLHNGKYLYRIRDKGYSETGAFVYAR